MHRLNILSFITIGASTSEGVDLGTSNLSGLER